MGLTARSWVLAGLSGLATIATAAVFGSLANSGWQVVGQQTDPADLLLTLVSTAGLLITLWFGAGLALSALAQLPGALGRTCGRVATRITPVAIRKVAALLVGTTIAAAVAPGTAAAAVCLPTRTGTVATATATSASEGAVTGMPDRATEVSPSAPDPAFRPPTAAPPVPDPGFRPDAPASPPVPATLGPLSTAVPRVATALDDGYVVRRGDTLWTIAARHLGPRASAAAVAREWPRWFEANRSLIGPNPHRIQAGQQLRPPDPTSETGSR